MSPTTNVPLNLEQISELLEASTCVSWENENFQSAVTALKSAKACLQETLQINAKIEEACEHDKTNGMLPAVFRARNIDGSTHIGVKFVPEGSAIGSQFHFDHGVGIHRNEDAEVLWIMEDTPAKNLPVYQSLIESPEPSFPIALTPMYTLIGSPDSVTMAIGTCESRDMIRIQFETRTAALAAVDNQNFGMSVLWKLLHRVNDHDAMEMIESFPLIFSKSVEAVRRENDLPSEQTAELVIAAFDGTIK